MDLIFDNELHLYLHVRHLDQSGSREARVNLCLLFVLVCMLSLIAMSRVILCIAVCLGKREKSLRKVHAGDPHAVFCFQQIAVSVQLKSFCSNSKR